jgi:hypothetical protein
MTAAIEGDCEVLSQVFMGAGIKSIQNEPLLVNILPLHRALSGFHFHGNQKLLVKTLATLLKFGADVNAVDAGGNTVLHKAIQVHIMIFKFFDVTHIYVYTYTLYMHIT